MKVVKFYCGIILYFIEVMEDEYNYEGECFEKIFLLINGFIVFEDVCVSFCLVL